MSRVTWIGVGFGAKAWTTVSIKSGGARAPERGKQSEIHRESGKFRTALGTGPSYDGGYQSGWLSDRGFHQRHWAGRKRGIFECRSYLQVLIERFYWRPR